MRPFSTEALEQNHNSEPPKDSAVDAEPENSFALFLAALEHPSANVQFEPRTPKNQNETDARILGVRITVVDTSKNEEVLASFSVDPGSQSYKRLRSTFESGREALREFDNPLFMRVGADILVYTYNTDEPRNPSELLRSWRALGQQRLALLFIALRTTEYIFAASKNASKEE